MTLGVAILTETGLAEVQTVQNDLEDLVAAENYGKGQLAEMKQKVLDAYRKDGGKELIENALARLLEADR